jgi:hypothetical protein
VLVTDGTADGQWCPEIIPTIGLWVVPAGTTRQGGTNGVTSVTGYVEGGEQEKEDGREDENKGNKYGKKTRKNGRKEREEENERRKEEKDRTEGKKTKGKKEGKKA